MRKAIPYILAMAIGLGAGYYWCYAQFAPIVRIQQNTIEQLFEQNKLIQRQRNAYVGRSIMFENLYNRCSPKGRIKYLSKKRRVK